MSCYHPHYALDLGLNSDTGKRIIKFLPKRTDSNLKDLRYKYGEDSVLCLPCGHCIGCYLDYAKEWSVRCICESEYYPDNTCWFITLTYNDENRPFVLEKAPLQKFIKDLRNDGYKVRYFACGERGSSGREHYHILLFGLSLYDLKVWKKSKGGYLFTSDFISKYWHYGFITVAHASYDTAGYIARYCIKKRIERNKDEFIIMSRRPGLGERYFHDHIDEIKKYDKVSGLFGSRYSSSIPRYFDKLCEKFDIDISLNKDNRLKLSKDFTRSDMVLSSSDHEEKLLLKKEAIQSNISKLKERSL